MTYLPERDPDPSTLDRVLAWILNVAIFLFIAWVIVQFMQFFHVIPQ